MTAPAQRDAAGFLARFEAMRDRLPGDPSARDAAAASFGAAGLPTIREEAWRYTSLRPVAQEAFASPADTLDPHGVDLRVPDLGCPRLVFVNARMRADLSRLPEGVSVSRFADAPGFGPLAHPERERLVALNTMFAEDGARIEVAPGVDGGRLLLVSIGAGAAGPVAFHPRHTIRLGAGARLTLLDIAMGEGVYLHNPVTESEIAEDATLVHVRLQDEAIGAYHLATIYTDIAARGTYDGFALTLGGRVSRAETHARLGGAGGSANLNGAQVLAGAQHGDFTSVVAHDAPGCASRQTVRNVLDGRARGVFQGRIEVARVAQKTDGYQMNQALLLSPEAEVDSKPELKIYADDVKCSHGATVGELNADQLFYLRSRGIGEIEARAMLVRAFLAGSLDAVADAPMRAVLDAAVDAWWERQRT
jgi:Fe-S cluster assembly protein SufD